MIDPIFEYIVNKDGSGRFKLNRESIELYAAIYPYTLPYNPDVTVYSTGTIGLTIKKNTNDSEIFMLIDIESFKYGIHVTREERRNDKLISEVKMRVQIQDKRDATIIERVLRAL